MKLCLIIYGDWTRPLDMIPINCYAYTDHLLSHAACFIHRSSWLGQIILTFVKIPFLKKSMGLGQLTRCIVKPKFNRFCQTIYRNLISVNLYQSRDKDQNL